MITVREFTKLAVDDYMYEVVNAKQIGCFTSPVEIITAGRSVINERYGDNEIVHFAVKSKRTIQIFINMEKAMD